MLILVALALLLMLPLSGAGTPALAGGPDYALAHRPDVVFPGGRVHRSPYPVSRRAAAVWHSDACFMDCAGQAAWRYEACLSSHGAEACRDRLDADDRICLQACRTRGGPLLNLTD